MVRKSVIVLKDELSTSDGPRNVELAFSSTVVPIRIFEVDSAFLHPTEGQICIVAKGDFADAVGKTQTVCRCFSDSAHDFVKRHSKE